MPSGICTSSGFVYFFSFCNNLLVDTVDTTERLQRFMFEPQAARLYVPFRGPSPKAFLSLFYRYSMFKYTSIALVSAGIFICTFMSAKQVVRFGFRSFVFSACHRAPLPGTCKERKGSECLCNTGTQLCESGKKWTAEMCPSHLGCCLWFWSLFLVYFLIS